MRRYCDRKTLIRLQLVPSGHFDADLTGFPEASGPAGAWFREHLAYPEPPYARSMDHQVGAYRTRALADPGC
jgi:hypothetical protein